MRKYLMIVLAVILIVLAYFTVTKGVSAGNFKILSWNELVDNNNNMNSKIEDLEKIVTVTYPQQQSDLNSSFKKLELEKNRYAEVVLYSSESELAKATQTEIYETEFLWTKIGNYATKNNKIDMKIDVVKGSSGIANQYNMNFTLVGQYRYISDFISAIENDSRLGFKIEKFYIVPEPIPEHLKDAETSKDEKKKAELEAWKRLNLLHATFTVENVGMNIKSNTGTTATQQEIENNANVTTSNTTTSNK